MAEKALLSAYFSSGALFRFHFVARQFSFNCLPARINGHFTLLSAANFWYIPGISHWFKMITSVEQGAAAKLASRTRSIRSLRSHTHTRLFPVAIETAESWGHQATELVQEIRRRITEHWYHWEQQGNHIPVSITLQTGNVTWFHS